MPVSSPAKVRVKATVAAFTAAYRVRRGMCGLSWPALNASSEATVTTAPSPAASMPGSAARASWTGATALRVSSRSALSGATSASEA